MAKIARARALRYLQAGWNISQLPGGREDEQPQVRHLHLVVTGKLGNPFRHHEDNLSFVKEALKSPQIPPRGFWRKRRRKSVRGGSKKSSRRLVTSRGMQLASLFSLGEWSCKGWNLPPLTCTGPRCCSRRNWHSGLCVWGGGSRGLQDATDMTRGSVSEL